jgi:Bacterial PH domain
VSRRSDKRDAERQRKLERHGLPLQRGESIILVAHPSLVTAWPKYLFTLGLYGLWRTRHTTVLTNRRILIGRGVISRSERSIPFDRINDARFVRNGYVGYTDLFLRGSNRIERIGPIRPRDARRLASEVLSQA